jgi:hypothetical protein
MGAVSHRKLVVLAAAALGLLALPVAAGAKNPCGKTAGLAKKSCELEVKSDRSLEEGKCLQSADTAAAKACQAEAKAAAKEEKEECGDQLDARRDLCERLDEEVYAPVLDPADFVAVIDNPYAPFAVGRTWVYEKEGKEGLERVEIEVLDETRTILGIEARVVRDREFLDSELVEDTEDWLAQDADGNVWYLGELSLEYEDGQLVGVEGSWEAGVDGAKPGLWMKAEPMVGDVYRQEFLLGEAEDAAEVLSLSEPVEVPAGSFPNCLQTADFTPLEPDALEHKFYAPGIGLVLEVDVESGERLELIEFSEP